MPASLRRTSTGRHQRAAGSAGRLTTFQGGLFGGKRVDDSGDKHEGAACYGSLTTGCLEHCRQCLDFHQSMASRHPLQNVRSKRAAQSSRVHSKWWNVFSLGWEPCCGLVLNRCAECSEPLHRSSFASLRDLRISSGRP